MNTNWHILLYVIFVTLAGHSKLTFGVDLSNKSRKHEDRAKRWVDLAKVTDDEDSLKNVPKPSKLFCGNDTKRRVTSPVSLGGPMGVKGQGQQGSGGGNNQKSKNQTLRFNKRYTKIRDLLFYQNDGEKLTFQLYEEDSSDASVRGENWDDEYVLAKGQFQWCHSAWCGAGHKIHGRIFPVELELIHYRRSDESLAKAWKKGGVLIISVLLRLVSRGVPTLTPLLSNIPYVAQPGPLKLLHAPVNFRQLLPSGDGFFTYEGSYTFSPCYDKVQRIVFETPIGIDDQQMSYFQYLLYEDKTPMKNNFAPLQEASGRTVTYYDHGFTIVTRQKLLKVEKRSHKHGELKRRKFVPSGQ